MTTRSLGALRPAVVPFALLLVAMEVLAGVGLAVSDDPLAVVLITLLPAPFLVVGTLIARRHPDNAMAWGFLGVAFLLSGVGLQEGLLAAHRDTGPLPGVPWVLLLIEALATLTAGLVTFVPAAFPDGRFPAAPWRWLFRVAGVVALASALGVLAQPSVGVGDAGRDVPNPLSQLPPLDALRRIVDPLADLVAIAALLSAPVALVLRWRRARAQQRAQIKLIVYLVGVYAVAGVVGFAMLSGRAEQLFSDALFPSFYVVFPSAVGVAILRHGLYDIDRLISRTLAYAVVTGGLVLPYLVVVPLVTRVVSSDLAVALATLAAAAAFHPLRRRVQARVDRRFNRARYDAARTIDDFSARLREEVALENVTEDLVSVVRQTMQPAHVTLWLRPAP